MIACPLIDSTSGCVYPITSNSDFYAIMGHIEEGSSCEVKLAISSSSGQLVVLKILKSEDRKKLSDWLFENEVSTYRNINHKHLVNMIDADHNAVFVQANQKDQTIKYLAMEVCKYGDLYNWVVDTGVFDENLARYYFMQMVDGIGHLHSKGISHRDIKLDNVLLTDDYQLKIADLGLASEKATCSDLIGTDGYIAPEIYLQNSYDCKAADIFALGVMLFILVNQALPFSDTKKSNKEYGLIRTKSKVKFWKIYKNTKLSKKIKDLIILMLSENPLERPSISEIKQHKWCKDKIPSKASVIKEMQRREPSLKRFKPICHENFQFQMCLSTCEDLSQDGEEHFEQESDYFGNDYNFDEMEF